MEDYVPNSLWPPRAMEYSFLVSRIPHLMNSQLPGVEARSVPRLAPDGPEQVTQDAINQRDLREAKGH